MTGLFVAQACCAPALVDAIEAGHDLSLIPASTSTRVCPATQMTGPLTVEALLRL